MNIGILTYHHVTNYGAVLQAWALSRFLRGQGHHVETIDYRPRKALEAYEKALYTDNPLEKENRERAARIEEFIRAHLPLSPAPFHDRDGFASLAGRYDAVITGSDEVWNINGFRGFDPSYFLDFASGSRRLSYAASFGFTATTGEHRDEITRLLKEFHAISVRDTHSADLIRNECGLGTVKVLDPTLLPVSYDPLRKLPAGRGFILVYANVWGEDAAFIRRFAEREGKPLIALAYPLDGAENRLTLSPEEWIGHFAAADYIFNGFFHGVAFSLINRKPFTAIAKPDKIIKVRDLLSSVGLEDRIVTAATPETPLPEPSLDYSAAAPALENLSSLSARFLTDALA